MGFIAFLLISGFLAIYIIAFAHIAQQRAAHNWLESSMIGFILDQVIFELAPSLIVALMAVLSGIWNCKCSLCLLIVIETYRAYRNLTDS